MGYRISVDENCCRGKNGEKLSWFSVLEQLKQRNGGKEYFSISLSNNKDIDDLGFLLDFSLCAICAENVNFLLVIKCSEKNENENTNKILNFLRYLIDSKRLEVKINGRLYQTSIRVEKNAPKNFFPLIVFNPKISQEIFLKTLEENAVAERVFGSFMNPMEETIDIDNFYTVITLRICASYLSSKNISELSEGAKGNIRKIYHTYWKNCNLITVLLSCILFNALRENERINSPHVVEFMKNMVTIAKVYALGLQEICENIERHTEEKKGVIYLRHLAKERVFERIKYSWAYGEDDERIKDDLKLCDNWLEISVIDAGKRGILETYKDEKRANQAEKLNDIYRWNKSLLDWDKSLIEDESRNEMYKLIYQKGLKVFSNHILNSRGYFSVMTKNGDKTQKYLESQGGFKEIAQNEMILGTQYRVWVPLYNNKEIIREKMPVKLEISDGYRIFQHYENESIRNSGLFDKEVSRHTICLDTKNNLDIVIEECKKLAIFLKSEKSQESEIVYLDFNDLKDRQIIKIILAVMLYSLKLHNKYIVLYNIDLRLFSDFKNNYEDLLEFLATQNQTIRVESPYIYVFDQNGTPIYLTKNFDKELTCAMRKYLYSYRGIFYNQEVERIEADNITESEKQSILLPLELMKGGEEFSAPIFERHLRTLFETDLEDNEKFGVKYQGHVMLGNTIHLETYYQGELLFDNNYYRDCLAIILARQLAQKKEDLFLVGFKKYSEGLIHRVKELLGDQVKGSYIYYGEEEIHKLNPEKKKWVIVIPLGSTLKTFNKVESFLRRNSGDNLDNILRFSFFVSRDAETDGSIEKEFGWSEVVDKPKEQDLRYIEILGDEPYPQKKKIFYFMLLKSRWHAAWDCEICREKDELLLDTKSDSLVLDTKLGFPYNMKVEGEEVYLSLYDEKGIRKEYKVMADYAMTGHYERSGNHFKYYLETKSFFEEYVIENKQFNAWIEYLQNSVVKKSEGYVNILLVPEHGTNEQFVREISNKVFKSNSIIIHENFEQEFYSDFEKKYSYLTKLKKIHYIFVDDCLNTGSTWRKVFSLVMRAQGDNSTAKHTIISLINRLDYQNKLLLSTNRVNHYSFMEISIPTIKEQDGNCWMCEEYQKLSWLKQESLCVRMQIYYGSVLKNQENISLGEEIDMDKVKEGLNRSRAENFLVTNAIYFKLFKEKEILKQRPKDVGKILGINDEYLIRQNIIGGEVTSSYKIALIKSISRPFLKQFYMLADVGLKVTLSELKILLRGEERAENVPFLIVLIKRLGAMGNIQLISKDMYSRLWKYYYKVKENDKELLSEILKDKPFQEHYAIAVRRLMFKNQVNTAAAFNTILSDKYWDEIEKDEKEFIEMVFCSKDYIIGKAYQSYLKDAQIAKQKQDYLKNYYYRFLKMELSFCNENSRNKEAKGVLAKLKDLEEEIKNNEPLDDLKIFNKGTIVGLCNLFIREAKDIFVYEGRKRSNYSDDNQMWVIAIYRLSKLSENSEKGMNKTENGSTIYKCAYNMIENNEVEKKMQLSSQNIKNSSNIVIEGKHLWMNWPTFDKEKYYGLLLYAERKEEKGLDMTRLFFAYRVLGELAGQKAESVISRKALIEMPGDDASEKEVKDYRS